MINDISCHSKSEMIEVCFVAWAMGFNSIRTTQRIYDFTADILSKNALISSDSSAVALMKSA